MKPKTLTHEHRRNISKGLMGRKVSIETRQKLSKAIKGRKFGPMTEADNLRKSAIQLGRVRGPMTNDQKIKLSVALRGRKLSAEHIRKSAEGLRGKKRTPECRKAISDRQLGIEKTGILTKKGPTNAKSRKCVLRDACGRVWFIVNVTHFIRTHPELFHTEDVVWKLSGQGKARCRALSGLHSLLHHGKKVSGTWKGWTVAFSIMERAEGGGDLLGRDCATVVELAKAVELAK